MTIKERIKKLTLKEVAGIIVALTIISGAVRAGVIKTTPYIQAFKRLPEIEAELIQIRVTHESDIEELKATHEAEMEKLVDTLKYEITLLGDAVNVLTGITSSNMWKVDTLDYTILWNGKTLEARLRLTLKDDLYVFFDAPRVGQRGFKVDRNNDRGKYTFTPFNGDYTFINQKK